MAHKIHNAGTGSDQQTVYYFHCPGCENDHAFHVPRWNWNGSLDKPTFTPSLLCNPDIADVRCHSFVTDGRIQFLDDCWHRLKGQTVDLPDWDEGQPATDASAPASALQEQPAIEPHYFQPNVSAEDPTGQTCAVPGCVLTEFGHLGEGVVPPAPNKKTVELPLSPKDVREGKVGSQVAEALQAKPDAAQAIAKVIQVLDTLEKRLSEIEKNLKHHGITGPRL